MAARRSSAKGSGGAKNPADRRRPTQERSRRRFEAIVATAAESFARQGFAETTMEGIAAQAETSIGSVYRFFPNKRALFREVAMRAMEKSRRSYGELLGPDPVAQPWHVMLDRFIDGFRRLHEREVTMQAIWRNVELYGEYAEADQALMRELVEATSMLLAGWAPALTADARRIIATMLVNTVATTLLVLARAESPAVGDAIVHETKLMLVRYLSAYLGEPATKS